MILSCNSCEKKFVVPDQAITAAGRTVQCGSCGNKWKQFPVKTDVKIAVSSQNADTNIKPVLPKTQKLKKRKNKKTKQINLYSPEYLEKKHGIVINKTNQNNDNKTNERASFGFYNLLLLFIVVLIASSNSLHFFQDFIVEKIPFSKFYLDYFFESIRNIFEIWRNLISNY